MRAQPLRRRLSERVNLSSEPLFIKPEDKGHTVFVKPGGYYPGEIDGVMPPASGGDWLKVSDKTDVVVRPDGTPYVTGIGSFVPTSTETEGIQGRLPGRKSYEGQSTNRNDWKVTPTTPPASADDAEGAEKKPAEAAENKMPKNKDSPKGQLRDEGTSLPTPPQPPTAGTAESKPRKELKNAK